jgi:hypothetical protein
MRECRRLQRRARPLTLRRRARRRRRRAHLRGCDMTSSVWLPSLASSRASLTPLDTFDTFLLFFEGQPFCKTLYTTSSLILRWGLPNLWLIGAPSNGKTGMAGMTKGLPLLPPVRLFASQKRRRVYLSAVFFT